MGLLEVNKGSPEPVLGTGASYGHSEVTGKSQMKDALIAVLYP